MSNNMYIAALRYGEAQLAQGKGITYFGLKSHLESLGHIIDLEKEPDISSFRILYSHLVLTGDVMSNYPMSPSQDREWSMNIEALFKLIEYQELQEAREASRQSQKTSLWAIGLTLFSLLVSIFVGYMQITGEVTISNKQVKSIISSIPSESSLIKEVNKMNSINMEKIHSSEKKK